ncbi:transporter substrate-binding domain-containing protein, partial [Desulfovibrio sp. OttesenSCG-928-G15]|nr:transporter substrate-binding domain-containing protein [Desulfovibrio sp. OttesenSCG-928-G15]
DIGMSSLSISPDRIRKVAFSRPYMSMRQGVLANQLQLAKLQGDTPAAKLNTPQAVIAVRNGSIYRQLLPRLVPAATVKEFPSWEECYDAVKNGSATGIIGDEGQLFTWLGRNKGDSMRLVPVLFNGKQDPIAIAVAKQNHDLTEYINAFLLHYQPEAMGIQEAYWKYKDEDEVACDPGLKQKIPAKEYPVLLMAMATAVLLAGSLIHAARPARKRPEQEQ